MRAEGVYPVVCSGYRTREVQQRLYDEEVKKYVRQGYTAQEAEELAKTWVAIPGTSEHEIGISVDINAMDERSTDQQVYEWLGQNSYKYGFILRYPQDKTDITGISHEPWHFRYVVKEAAEEIYTKGLCLEEYLVLKRCSPERSEI
jgi:D-alanyl-D-alanine carboxypeptidase